MRLRRYVGRHLKPRPKKHGPVVVGTAAALWISAPAAQAHTYVVREGDSLSEIATRHGTSVGALARANGLSDPNMIIAGQSLKLSGRTASATQARHRVRHGETLSTIARRYGTSISSLARANNLSNPNLILAGTSLKVPARRSAVSSAAASPAVDVATSLHRHSVAHGVDPALVKAVAWQESGWQQHVVSSKGAVGVMQVIPGTARYVNEVLGGGDLRLRNADDNVRLGVIYLKRMIDIMPSVDKALAAYYTGPGNVGKRLTKEQSRYVANVKALADRYR